MPKIFPDANALQFDEHIFAAPTYHRGMTAQDLPEGIDPADIVKMSSNENPLGSSAKVIEAVQNEAATLAKYPPRDGDHNLRAALAKLHGKGLTPDHFFAGNGGLDVLDMAARGFIRPGDEMITFTPTFKFFEIAASRLGAKIVSLPLDAQDDFQMDIDRMLDAITPKTKAIYICNPNNPTGNLIGSGQIDKLIDQLPANVILIADEVYSHFADQALFADTTPAIHAGKNVIQIYSFSKAFGLAGLRLGYAIARPQIADYLARLRYPFHLGRMTLAAGIAAANDTAFVEKTVDTMVSGRGWLTNQLHELGVKVWESQTNFLLVDAGIPGTELTTQFLNRGIIVSEGKQRFNLPDCIRITVGLPHQNQRFIEALAEILA